MQKKRKIHLSLLQRHHLQRRLACRLAAFCHLWWTRRMLSYRVAASPADTPPKCSTLVWTTVLPTWLGPKKLNIKKSLLVEVIFNTQFYLIVQSNVTSQLDPVALWQRCQWSRQPLIPTLGILTTLPPTGHPKSGQWPLSFHQRYGCLCIWCWHWPGGKTDSN